MIFPNLELEPIVQVGDRTRLSAVKSFVTQDEAAIDLVMIRPEASADFITVTSDKYLDWVFSASGVHTVTCRVAASGASAEVSGTISVLTADQDYLFSSDSDLRTHESDILKWTEDGRNSFLNIHRRVQTLILDELRREGYVDTAGEPYTKAAVISIPDVRQWATMWALQIIFESISNATDDVFHEKSVYYSALRQTWGKTIFLRLDTDGDGNADHGEGIDTATTFVARR